MKKKYFFKFFLFTVFATLVTFTACKDYDDDISRLESEISTLKGMSTDLTAIRADIAAAQTAANNALAKANEALEAAQGTGDAAAVEAAQEAADKAQAKADEVETKATELEGLIEALEGRIATLEALDSPSKEDLEALDADMKEIVLKLEALVGKNLRSLVLIPHHYVNGIEAIGFNPLAYVCGGLYDIENSPGYNEMYEFYKWGGQRPVSVSTRAALGDIVRANPNTVLVQYHVNPSSVTEDMIDVDNLSFTYKLQEHKTRSADINAKAEFVSLENGILTVRVDLDANEAEDGGMQVAPWGFETMDMIALQVPLSEEAKEDDADYEAVITSDWARVDVEDLAYPVIDKVGTLCGEDVGGDDMSYSSNYSTLADAIDTDNPMEDPYLLELVYDKDHDLLDYVTSTALSIGGCDEFDPAEYGLEWNFDLLDEEGEVIVYELTNLNTDQQEFIKLNDNQGNIEAKVYTTSGTDAIGKTPVVRVQLIDPATDCLVTQGFVKIKWIKEHDAHEATYPAQDVDFTCGDGDVEPGIEFGVDVEWMNVEVYNAMDTYYEEFIHNNELDEVGIYDEDGELVDWGTVEENADFGSSTDTDLFKVHLNDICDLNEDTTFEGYVYYRSTMDNEIVTVKIKVTMNVVMPELGVYGHLGQYWKENYSLYTLNPLNYGSTADPQPNPTASYKTNLLNGFSDADGNVPQSAAEAVKATLNDTYEVECAQFEFDPVALEDYSFTINGDVYSVANDNLKLDNNNTDLVFGIGTGSVAATIRVDGTRTYIAVDEQTQEANPWAIGNDPNTQGSWPNEFSRALVGKEVPVRLVADLCCEVECLDPIVVKQYRVKFIKPLEMNAALAEDFVDAEGDGSRISIASAVTYEDWNFKTVANTSGEAQELYRYYEVLDPVWDLTGIKSNLKADAEGNIVPTDGVTDGNIPLDGTEPIFEIEEDGTDLVFYNNGSTIDPTTPPVTLYIPVSVTHKWGTETKTVSVQVLPAAGNQ